MGVVNVTPDSFSDGGLWLDPEAAVSHGLELHAEGAAILDVGGESTRPGAAPVDEAEELRRIEPVVRALHGQAPGAVISIDTMKASVAEAALAAGASYVNDVTALRGDPRMAQVVAEAGCEVCLMHMAGTPQTMQEDPSYEDVVGEVVAFLAGRAEAAVGAGIAPERIQLDPGIGFGKSLEHNLELLGRLDEIAAIGFPVVAGLSRKRFLGAITGREEPAARVAASVAAAVLAWERGASVLRAHDVAATVDGLKVAAATLGAR
ncbi:MAG: dihydropteroate synthase [Solirubrobacterales bacterium]